MIQGRYEDQNGRSGSRRSITIPSAGVWVGCTQGGSWRMVLKPRPFSTYLNISHFLISRKQRMILWGAHLPQRIQSLQAEPLLFSRVWIPLPSPAITLTPMFSTYNVRYFFTGCVQFVHCSSLSASWFWGHKRTHVLSLTKWCHRMRNLSTKTKVYQKYLCRVWSTEVTVNSRELVLAIH